MSLQELWWSRRWRELLNLIEGLPTTSWTQEAIAMDEEFVRAAVESKDPDEIDDAAHPPPLRDWDQTASLLASLIEEVRQTNILLIATNAKKGATLPKLKPVLRPVSAYQKIMSKVKMDSRLRRHDSLVARLLGDRAKKNGDQ